MIEQPKNKIEEMRQVLERLQSLLKKGFLLHGVKQLVKGDLEPQQLHDNNLEAVSATDHLFLALKDALFHESDSEEDNIVLKPGIIYILDPGEFEKIKHKNGDNTGKEIEGSHTLAKPILSIKIYPEILYLLPNFDLKKWI